MKNLSQQIDQIEQYIPKLDVINPLVSKSSVGWQLDHSLRVINSIITAFEHSKPEDYKFKFNLKRILVMTSQYIPRGKARAPKQVISKEEITVTSLKLKVKVARKNVEILKTLDKKSNFSHPYLGIFRLKSGIKFIRIHTRHHLKIVSDILKFA